MGGVFFCVYLSSFIPYNTYNTYNLQTTTHQTPTTPHLQHHTCNLKPATDEPQLIQKANFNGKAIMHRLIS